MNVYSQPCNAIVHQITATCLQRPPQLSTTATSLQRPPLYYGYHSTAATSLRRPSLYNVHLSTTATCSITATSLQWPPRSLQRPPLQLLPPLYNGHPFTMANLLPRPPFYYGHTSAKATFFRFSLVSALLIYFGYVGSFC